MHGQPPVRQDAALSPGIRTPAWAELGWARAAASRLVQAGVERHRRVLSAADPDSGPGIVDVSWHVAMISRQK